MLLCLVNAAQRPVLRTKRGRRKVRNIYFKRIRLSNIFYEFVRRLKGQEDYKLCVLSGDKQGGRGRRGDAVAPLEEGCRWHSVPPVSGVCAEADQGCASAGGSTQGNNRFRFNGCSQGQGHNLHCAAGWVGLCKILAIDGVDSLEIPHVG